MSKYTDYKILKEATKKECEESNLAMTNNGVKAVVIMISHHNDYFYMVFYPNLYYQFNCECDKLLRIKPTKNISKYIVNEELYMKKKQKYLTKIMF